MGLEVSALTAVVLGGNSLGGGRGSVAKAVMGGVSWFSSLTNSLINFGVTGPATSMILGGVLIGAVFIDRRWLVRTARRWLSKVYVSPTYLKLAADAARTTDPGSPYALNDKLRTVEIIGLGQIEGPEDVILDRDDQSLLRYTTGRYRALPRPGSHPEHEVFAHIGGHPLGMAFDRAGNLLVCIGGMGLYQVSPDRAGDEADGRDEPKRVLGRR